MSVASEAHGRACAKLILSGEHSIVAGQPALAIPIPLYTHAHVHFEAGGSPGFFVRLKNFNQAAQLMGAELAALGAQKHQLWQQSQKNVLDNPFDLVWLTLWQFQQWLPLAEGHYAIEIDGHGLIGRGLGSSAAVVISLIRALLKLVEVPLADDALLTLATRIEHYVHGRSSGLDPAVLLHETPLWVERTPTGLHTEPFVATIPPFHLIDTGEPLSRTGECVAAVRQRFPAHHPIWPAFGDTTRMVRTALQQQDDPTLRDALCTNHVLLRKIGVVPDAVNGLIAILNRHGAAKISGAGAIRGQAAGVVIHFGDPLPETVLSRHNATLISLKA
ncbi:MAG TPA: hypothetical protein EYH46_03145 [Sulfurivirga caldicuralii]|nr:hypothetical protein [Sulfurivirga caldicuralii]